VATDRWAEAALELERWMADRDYAGYDPHDFLASPLVRAATLGSRWAGVAWTQVGKRLPVQLRSLLRVPALRNPKAVGLVLAGRARLERSDAVSASTWTAGGVAAVDEMVWWLERVGVRGYGGVGWGYPFPWANREFMVPAGTPSSVATAFVGHGLLDLAETLRGRGPAAAPVARLAGRLADEAGGFLAGGLARIPGPADTFCFSYTPLDRRAVHNASLLAASLLARLQGVARPEAASVREPVELARRATLFTLAAQRPDGSWPYGVAARDGWVDSFHTGYVLLALEEVARHLEVPALEEAVERGVAYWRAAFFQGPAVSHRPGGRYPVDTHAVAQAILTFLGLRHRVPGAVEEARRLGRWAVTEMRDPAGFYYYQHHGGWRNRLPYMRWVQAWMYRALVELALVDLPADGAAGP
jgi:hypothetical protein